MNISKKTNQGNDGKNFRFQVILIFFITVCKKGYTFTDDECKLCANKGEYKDTVSDDACKTCIATYSTGSTTVSETVANTALSACGNF